MRRINRVGMTKSFSAKGLTPPTTSADAKNKWRKVTKKQKKDMKRLLSIEQSGLCAYTELRILDNEFGTHLEHIKPKSKFPSLTFSDQNLVLNAMSPLDEQKYDKKDYFGGCHKGDDYDAAKFLSCVEIDGNDYFSFPISGEVHPKATLDQDDRARAEYTIKLLNLNSSLLVNRRRKLLEVIEKDISEILENDLDIDTYRRMHNFIDSSTGSYTDSFISASTSRFN